MDKYYLPRIEKVEASYGNKTLTFPEFVDYIFKSFKYFKCNKEHCPNIDAHWMPYLVSIL
jgi:hypothetical protein